MEQIDKRDFQKEVTSTMKKIIMAVASLMMTILIGGLFLYEKSNQVKHPEWSVQETPNKPQKPQQLQPILVDGGIGYSLQNDELQITFNEGEDWTTVPIKKDLLFMGDFVGSNQELIDHSYMISKERIIFLYLEKEGYVEDNRVIVTYSEDQGTTWENSVVSAFHPYIGFRKIDFLSDQFGYIIFTGERVMSEEASFIYITNDGGAHWELTNHPDTTRLVYEGGFIDEMIGFLSVGYTNPKNPELHVTQDEGNTWNEAQINVPAEYSEIFLIAEMPYHESGHLAVLVNQGPEGDYLGGRVKGKFISIDQGLTWEFSEEVEPDE